MLEVHEAEMSTYVPTSVMDAINSALVAKVIYQNIPVSLVEDFKKRRLGDENQVIRPLADKYYPDFES